MGKKKQLWIKENQWSEGVDFLKTYSKKIKLALFVYLRIVLELLGAPLLTW